MQPSGFLAHIPPPLFGSYGLGVRVHSPPKAIRCLLFLLDGIHPWAPMRSPVSTGKFSRLSLSRFISYLPLLSFGPSATVPGSTYLLLHLSVSECLTSLADAMA